MPAGIPEPGLYRSARRALLGGPFQCTGTTTTSTITAASAMSAPLSAMRVKTRRSVRRATNCIARPARATRDTGQVRPATGRRWAWWLWTQSATMSSRRNQPAAGNPPKQHERGDK